MDLVTLTIARADFTAAPSQALVAALNAELSGMYSEPGANHFGLDPAEVSGTRGAFLIVSHNGTPVGCGAVRLIAADTGELKRMYMAPSVRGKGLGRRLVAALEAEARALGARRLVLETGIRQAAALALYRATGFQPIPLYGEYLLSPDTSICLGKELADGAQQGIMTDFDPAAIERWALGYLNRLSDGGKRGVLLGGSIARGQQWAHSDLEAGLLVEAHDPSLPYFNVDSGRGVEVIQLVSPDLIKQLAEVERGDLAAVSTWPIQLYQARVISDPTGLLVRFVAQFDRHLFSPSVARMKLAHHAAAAARALEKARALVAADRPRAALCEVRSAMNEAVLALHWSLGELPRSHNRVDSRLRDLTMRHSRPEFYALYRDVFELDTADDVIRHDWPVVKERVLEIASAWRARAFFETAVDGTFSWGENGGIISVHRLFIPIIGGPEAGIFDSLDEPGWAAANPELLRFLGLAAASAKTVSRLAGRIEHALTAIN